MQERCGVAGPAQPGYAKGRLLVVTFNASLERTFRLQFQQLQILWNLASLWK